jgi:succinate dehydrogenase / fumarate reductase cytochrome b subunit
MNKRPLSPHLSVYRLPLSANMSILHRITGAAMFGCLSFLCWYFILQTFYGVPCECLAKLAYIAGVALSFTFFYHISTGIRHLIWDMGYFMSKEYFVSSGLVCMIFSIFLAIWFWIL